MSYRTMIRIFRLVSLLVAPVLTCTGRAEVPPSVIEAASIDVPRWQMHEFVARGRCHVENAFQQSAFVGEFTAPSGQVMVVEGFFDGDDTWRLRFAPTEEGRWTYLLRGEGFEYQSRGTLTCLPAVTGGFIGIHPSNPYAFARSDGSAFFPMGDTCYGLFDDSPITPELRSEYLATRRSQRFNFVRMTIGHSERQAARNPGEYWAWGGTPKDPDLDRFNPTFFRKFDDLMRQMLEAGMNAELLVYNGYRRPFTDPTLWTAQRERQWLRYIVSRYAAFTNVFLWTVANEYETYPDGKYRLDFPDDPNWAKRTARAIKSFDPYHHPVTVHPVISASRRGESPRAGYDPPWRIGEFFGTDDALDVLSQQTGQSGEGTRWDDAQQCWVSDARDVAASIAADRRHGRPVLNTENGYEYRRGGPTGRQQVHHTDKVRRTSWRIVVAGGYFAAGFNGTIGHSDAWNRIDQTDRYTFSIRDEGAASQLARLYDYVTALPYWRMEPFGEVTGEMCGALAWPGEAYLVYLPRGGSGSIDLGHAGPVEFSCEWLNPREDETLRQETVRGGATHHFKAPDSLDWVLVLRRQHVSGD